MESEEQLRERYERILARLGDTEQQVADNLKLNECQGIPGQTGYCPVATYLKRAGGPSYDVQVMDDWVRVQDRQIPRTTAIVDLPQSHQTFIEQFDDGKYPALDEDILEVAEDAL